MAGQIPSKVRVGVNSLITDTLGFKRFHSKRKIASGIGGHCTMEGVHFDLSELG
jgi:hypothetical protein